MVEIGQKLAAEGELNLSDEQEVLEHCYYESVSDGTAPFNWQHELRKARLALKAKGK